MNTQTASCLLLAVFALSTPSGAQKPTHDHAHVQSVGKASAPVRMVNSPEFEGAVGNVVSVPLELIVTQPTDTVQVRLSASDGLRIKSDVVEYTFEGVLPGALPLPAMDVHITAAGRHSVTASVILTTGGQIRGSAMGVAVVTPGAKQTAQPVNKQLANDARGRALRVMPATETP